MKKCKFCAEEIQDEAIKCRYCGEFLNKASADPSTSAVKPEPAVPLASTSNMANPCSIGFTSEGKVLFGCAVLVSCFVGYSMLGFLDFFTELFGMGIFLSLALAAVIRHIGRCPSCQRDVVGRAPHFDCQFCKARVVVNIPAKQFETHGVLVRPI